MISEAEKQAEILKAEGEAEYMKIMADAYNDPAKADFLQLCEKPGCIEEFNPGRKQNNILDKDSPLTQIFYQAQ